MTEDPDAIDLTRIAPSGVFTAVMGGGTGQVLHVNGGRFTP